MQLRLITHLASKFRSGSGVGYERVSRTCVPSNVLKRVSVEVMLQRKPNRVSAELTTTKLRYTHFYETPHASLGVPTNSLCYFLSFGENGGGISIDDVVQYPSSQGFGRSEPVAFQRDLALKSVIANLGAQDGGE